MKAWQGWWKGIIDDCLREEKVIETDKREWDEVVIATKESG